MKRFISAGYRSLLVLMLSLTPAAYADTSSTSELYRLELQNTDNEAVDLSAYKGKILLLNFWATWCPPCVKEMPSMQRLRNHFSEQPFEIIAINIGESSTAVSSFLLELDTELTFPILLDEEGKSYQVFGIRGLPMTLLLDKQGELLSRTLGGKDWDSAASIQLVQAALNAEND
ncbi:MAG: thiol-disulfide isomerase/thioredoxin [Neptuniibacter pectenicola]|jgi:thiol-disulfide isomerase/thioredoxin|uniref:TlpA disulfide reductase family protein n=1 Tax=Neptuniibacter pectenicola TaxID=1806669 RepID=UPI000795D375|nr:MAG: thioredoxin family protein [Neptuniibacter sp. Phe_28]|tara:strand:- start:11598 stop:12119 length:522 start_codon:yes stop_codon:yes gene_type:complete